jgi:hypothetical protein
MDHRLGVWRSARVAALSFLLLACRLEETPVQAPSTSAARAGLAGSAAVPLPPPGSPAESGSSGAIPPLRWEDGGLATPGPADAGVPAADGGSATARDVTLPEPPAFTRSMLADASVPSGLDAGSVDALPADGCEGARVLGLCWYLGEPGSSWRQTCAAHGGVDERAAQHVGTPSQGGSLTECGQVMSALGHAAPLASAFRSDVGLGCHVWSDGRTYWLDDPSRALGPEAAHGVARIASACQR